MGHFIMFAPPVNMLMGIGPNNLTKNGRQVRPFISKQLEAMNINHYKESCPFQPMHLQILFKSTIFATLHMIVLSGTW
jgi:hypothetical protein